MYASQKSRVRIKHLTTDVTFPPEPSHSTAAASTLFVLWRRARFRGNVTQTYT